MQHWVCVSAFNDPIFHGKLMALIISIVPQDKDSMPFSTEKMTFHYLASTGGEQSSQGMESARHLSSNTHSESALPLKGSLKSSLPSYPSYSNFCSYFGWAFSEPFEIFQKKNLCSLCFPLPCLGFVFSILLISLSSFICFLISKILLLLLLYLWLNILNNKN